MNLRVGLYMYNNCEYILVEPHIALGVSRPQKQTWYSNNICSLRAISFRILKINMITLALAE